LIGASSSVILNKTMRVAMRDVAKTKANVSKRLENSDNAVESLVLIRSLRGRQRRSRHDGQLNY
jgi:hypothetical protein